MKNSTWLIVTLLSITAAFCLLTTQALADPKLTVEDGANNPVFIVNDDGTTSFTGQDLNNSFSYKVIGHTGGSSHTQTVTDLADSRLTVMAAEADDYAPRLQMIGPQDVAAAVRGWMIFDYGSAKYALPDARFVLRYFDGTGNTNATIMETVGETSVSFPSSLAGPHDNGSAYVCVNDSGTLFTSETGCP